MENLSKVSGKVTVGLDLGDRFSVFHVLGPDGEFQGEGRVQTTPAAFSRHFARAEPLRIALETGTHSPWVSRLLEDCGHEVIVANSRRLRLISENDRKSDRADAQCLARLARLDPQLLKPVRHRSAPSQQALATIRARDALVKSRKGLVNHVRGAVKSAGGRVRGCTTDNFGKKAMRWIPAQLEAALAPLVQTIQTLSEKIADFDKAIAKLCKDAYQETERLRQVIGVGPVTALAFVLILDNAARFTKSRTVGAYLGLTPRMRASGDRDPQLRITKAGDSLLRRLLVNCAQYILGPFGPDCDLRRHGESIAARGAKNAKKRAVVAVARKLAVLLHRLWQSGERYEPLRNSEPRSRRRPRGKMIV